MFIRRDPARAVIRKMGINLLIAGLAIVAGGLIYVLFRAPDWGFLHRRPSAGPEWIVFSLPDGLWAFAYTLIILTIWHNSNSILRYFWYATIPMLALGSEFLQQPGIVPGTFCLNDLVLIACGLVAGILAANLTLTHRIHENAQTTRHAG